MEHNEGSLIKEGILLRALRDFEGDETKGQAGISFFPIKPNSPKVIIQER